MTRCLLVDDDADIRTLLVHFLQQHGIAVEALADGASFRRRAAAADVDLLLLDLMLPDDDGLVLCRWIKQQRPALPVIMLTAQGDPISRVLGLEIGADDYLPKPFEPRELVARIRAVLRRGHAVAAASGAVVAFGGWRFDRLQRALRSADGTVVPLSATEFRLLGALIDHAGQVLSRERLLQLTQGGAGTAAASERSIDLAISRLRGKLGERSGAPLIRTMRGAGYLLDATPVDER
ncbi:response regulator [Aquabacterium humicola]|uniref:response regulator n=1 Tax=Aquabacterium humicola TaxID=3237377 RepID=UPI002542D336|nr:response regulator transcription factor [Rubrivivax pictus]